MWVIIVVSGKKCAMEFLWRTFIHEIRKAERTHNNKRWAIKRSRGQPSNARCKILTLSCYWSNIWHSQKAVGLQTGCATLARGYVCFAVLFWRNLYYGGRFLDRVKHNWGTSVISFQLLFWASDLWPQHNFSVKHVYLKLIFQIVVEITLRCGILKSLTNIAA